MTQEEQWKAICLWDSGSGSIFFSSQVTIRALKTRFSRAPSVNSGKHIHHSYLNLVPGHQSSKQYIYLHLVNKLRTPSITATISSSHLSTRKKSRIIRTNTRSNLKNLTPIPFIYAHTTTPPYCFVARYNARRPATLVRHLSPYKNWIRPLVNSLNQVKKKVIEQTRAWNRWINKTYQLQYNERRG